MKRLTLISISILLTLLGLELIIRVVYSSVANYHTEMFRYASDLKQLLPDDNLPFHHLANASGDYYGVSIQTNSHGFRDVEYPIQKPEETYRIIVLGDSVALGWGVPMEKTFAKLLENKLNETGPDSYEVVNMGTGNYNSAMELELLKKKGIGFQPDLVILTYFINDAEETPEISGFATLLKQQSYLYAFLYGKFLDIVPHMNPDKRWDSYITSLYTDKNPNLESHWQALEEIIELTRDNRIELLVISFPDLHQLENYPFYEVTDRIRAIFESQDILFLDLLPSFQDYQSEELWVSREDPHPNAIAHGIAARRIHEVIMEKVFLVGSETSL